MHCVGTEECERPGRHLQRNLLRLIEVIGAREESLQLAAVANPREATVCVAPAYHAQTTIRLLGIIQSDVYVRQKVDIV